MPVDGEERPCDGADNIADVSELGVQRHQDIGKLIGVIGALPQAVVEFPEAGKAFFLMTEDLHDFLPFHHFLDITVYLTDILLLCHKVPS